jgi:hypothetical protein
VERNPYLILGLPFGAGREEANAAFVRRARRARRGELPGVEQTDLTWALNQIDEAVGDPRTALGTYRVPALPEAFAAPASAGLLRPPPERFPARPADRGEALLRAQSEAALECLRRLVVLRGSRTRPSGP